MQKLPPICAMFLTQFDVHSGYELKWFKSLDDDLYSSKDIEFKSMPSGLHAVSTDTICFVKRKGDFDSLLYGISIFKQNNHLQQITNDGNVDRNKVKLYSLGVLIDPIHLESLDAYKNWKPKVYSAVWNYKHDLSQLLNNFMNLSTKKQENDYFTKFNKFFTINNFKQPLTPPKTSESISETSKLTAPELYPIKSRTSILSAFSDEDLKNDHMIDSLIPFVNDFGPLIFKIWKILLLRKSIILYSPYTSTNVCIDGNDEIKHDNFTIGEMSKFIFCMSLISSIPKELETSLKRSIKRDISSLLFNRPIYNICVNDIYEIVKLDSNYLASTTDQIIIEKISLYDYAVRLPLNYKLCNNESNNVPEVHNSVTNKLEYATPKDYERFKIINSSLNNTVEENPIALKVSESRSIQELIWNGLAWWASAGETFTSIYDEFNTEFENFDTLSPSSDNAERIVTLVGYFQQITIKLFIGLIQLKDRFDSENINNERPSSSVMILDAHDMLEIGLDPYSSSDHAFVIELVKVWWKIDVKIGSYFDDFCCWN